jgi:hypothetical protein
MEEFHQAQWDFDHETLEERDFKPPGIIYLMDSYGDLSNRGISWGDILIFS